ncbi:MAG: helix-turn-helix domain-containing protein, partial [Candidatus Binatia bacterium]
ELENVVERAVLMCPGPEINLDDLYLEQKEEEASPPLLQETRAVTELVEREKIVEAMQRARGNRSQAARLLGISRATLYNKLARYHLTH